MGQDAAATLSEIEAARHRLEQDIDELDRRARPEHDLPEQAKRIGAAAGAAGLGLTVLVGLSRRRWRTHRAHQHARLQADALADVLDRRRRSAGRVALAGDDDQLSRDARAGAIALTAAAAFGAVVARLLGRG